MTGAIDRAAVPCRTSDAVEREREGELLLFLDSHRPAFRLNSSARAIWELCDGHRSVFEISRELGRAFGVPAEALLADVKGAIERLVKAKALAVLGDRQPRGGAASSPSAAPADLGEITHRDQIPGHLSALGLTGWGIELGVRHGVYSNVILARSELSILFSVDCWSERGYGAKDYLESARLLAAYGTRSVVLRMTFLDAARLFGDRSLDFAYLDGFADNARDTLEHLRLWWPKVKTGGVFAGHDYCPQWPAVKTAVDAFAGEQGIAVHVTSEQPGAGHGPYPSWITRKTA